MDADIAHMALEKNKSPIVISWSGGKDSSLMLQRIQNNDDFKIAELFTIVNKQTSRVGLHGIHEDLIRAQARSIGLTIRILYLSSDSTNSSYETLLDQYYNELQARNIFHVGFGDIFLQDLRSYRDQQLKRHHLKGIYPLWQCDTNLLAKEFVEAGFRSIICACDKKLFTPSIAGKDYSFELIDQLPSDVDPCGENGEFHSFVYDGPVCNYAIKVMIEEIVTKEYHFKCADGSIASNSFDFAHIKLQD